MKTLSILCAVSALVALCAMSTWALAEDLPDPTKPPPGYAQNAPADAVVAGPQLQSILISPTRRVAIISGKTLQTGDKFEGAVLVAINDNEVVLRNGKSSQVLKLFPSLRKPVAGNRPGNNIDSSGKQR